MNNALGNTFGDGGLSDSRVADQNRIVLRPPRKDLQHTANLLFAAYDRVKFPLTRKVVQIARKSLKGLIFLLRRLIRHSLGSAEIFQRLVHALLCNPLITEELSCGGFRLEHGKQKMLGAYVFILELSSFFLCGLQRLHKNRGEMLRRGSSTLHLRHFLDRFGNLDPEVVDICPQFLQDRRHNPFAVLNQGCKEVLWLKNLIAVIRSNLLGILHGLLGFNRKFVDVHSVPSLIKKRRG